MGVTDWLKRVFLSVTATLDSLWSLLNGVTVVFCTDQWFGCDGYDYFASGYFKQINYDANQSCIRFGSRLAEIYNDQDWNCAKQAFIRAGTHAAWIGLNDLRTEGVFRWNGNDAEATYTRWAQNEPNPTRWEEDCVRMGVAGQNNPMEWFDLWCYYSISFICQKSKLHQ